ncbi:DUF6932 family protein [Anatilimnocola floriformis]|uniref:DUF6932 family protein n=1 Tax=Anatilimnocola floriformis TaxID=2948575 RepID=UPI0020C45AF0|nr:hypothetical protein [Anatilimnocola floriformis]
MESESNPGNYTSLWPAGFHFCDLGQIRLRCVTAEQFRNSTVRDKWMNRLEMIAERMTLANVNGELWVDGSFVTTKLNPRDLDVCFYVKAELLEQGNKIQREAVKWFDRLQITHGVDAYISTIFSVTDPRHEETLNDYLFWKNLWGTSRNNSPQGIVVLRL